jgi:hypothetical protein
MSPKLSQLCLQLIPLDQGPRPTRQGSGWCYRIQWVGAKDAQHPAIHRAEPRNKEWSSQCPKCCWHTCCTHTETLPNGLLSAPQTHPTPPILLLGRLSILPALPAAVPSIQASLATTSTTEPDSLPCKQQLSLPHSFKHVHSGHPFYVAVAMPTAGHSTMPTGLLP